MVGLLQVRELHQMVQVRILIQIVISMDLVHCIIPFIQEQQTQVVEKWALKPVMLGI